MAKTSYIQIPSGQEQIFAKALKSGDRFLFSKIIRNDTLLSKSRKKGISKRSMLPRLSILWQAFSTAEKLAWKNAAAFSDYNGWQLFVQDQCLRYKNDMSGVSTPNNHHQSWVGQCRVTSPASEIKIAQYHPNSYFIKKKVYGSKNLYFPKEITEDFYLPLKIGISYKSNLTSQGAGSFAKFYATIWNSYQGHDDQTDLIIDLDLSSDWQTLTETLSSIRGTLLGYTLFIELHNVTGDFFFDNVIAEHDGQNWVRDFRCNNIDTMFTKAFYQIPKNWVAEILPDGAEFDSIFKDF